MQNQLKAISPIDGRYQNKTQQLSDYFSEYALIKFRTFVEIEYFKALSELEFIPFSLSEEELNFVNSIYHNFNIEDAAAVKEIEKTTNHDVKAVEYFIKDKLKDSSVSPHLEWIHFGLTSQDINNTANPMMLLRFVNEIYYPAINDLIVQLEAQSKQWNEQAMLAKTHGQPASPTVLGKEWMVFIQRLKNQLSVLKEIPVSGKFGGATGNMNAHYIAYPNYDWHQFAGNFLNDRLGIERQHPTTQIEHYDHLASFFDAVKRINVILLDLSKDIWTYISMDYFKQKLKEGEIGSSAMPHKVNPIDFENAEGNLGIANAILIHLAEKLPISRLQRDLTDSTVSRNIGVPFAHTIIAFKSLAKGLDKLIINESKINEDLENNWAVVAEALQTILRREAYPKPYEALKNLTRTNKKIDKSAIHDFIQDLDVNEGLKIEMMKITPHNFIGRNV